MPVLDTTPGSHFLSTAHDGKVFTPNRREASGREWLGCLQTLQVRPVVQKEVTSLSYQKLAAVRLPEQGITSESLLESVGCLW